MVNQILYVSATQGPMKWGKKKNCGTGNKAYRVVRSTIEVRPIEGQIDNLISEINKRIEKKKIINYYTYKDG